jgi:hypothetical protein
MPGECRRFSARDTTRIDDTRIEAVRPLSSMNYLTPHEFKQQHHRTRSRAVLRE